VQQLRRRLLRHVGDYQPSPDHRLARVTCKVVGEERLAADGVDQDSTQSPTRSAPSLISTPHGDSRPGWPNRSLSQITWRTSVAHDLTEDNEPRRTDYRCPEDFLILVQGGAMLRAASRLGRPATLEGIQARPDEESLGQR
jgi:hypothetical protein